MRVMVTGGTGFTGSHSVRALQEAGHDICLLVRDPDKVKRVYEPLGVSIDDIVVGDMEDPGPVGEALSGCDAVLHAAAMVDLKASQARAVIETNRAGVENVVGQAAERGLERIVYVSSLSIFFHPGCPPLHPDLPIPPASTAYGESKAAAEVYVRSLQERGAPIHVTYPVGIIGPDDPGMSDANHAVYSWFRDLTLRTSSGFQIVDVRDVAELHRLLIEHRGRPGRFAAAGEMLAWNDIPEFISSLTGTRIRALTIPGPMLRVLGRIGDRVKGVVDFNFPLTRDSMCFATQWPGTEDPTASRSLGLRFRPVRETYVDTLRWMQRAGHLSAEQIGRLADARAPRRPAGRLGSRPGA